MRDTHVGKAPLTSMTTSQLIPNFRHEIRVNGIRVGHASIAGLRGPGEHLGQHYNPVILNRNPKPQSVLVAAPSKKSLIKQRGRVTFCNVVGLRQFLERHLDGGLELCELVNSQDLVCQWEEWGLVRGLANVHPLLELSQASRPVVRWVIDGKLPAC